MTGINNKNVNNNNAAEPPKKNIRTDSQPNQIPTKGTNMRTNYKLPLDPEKAYGDEWKGWAYLLGCEQPLSSKEKKVELLRMAEAGEPRPNDSTSLGKALSDYTHKKGNSYDESFDVKIKNIGGYWYVDKESPNDPNLTR